jgi:hypothetical protein
VNKIFFVLLGIALLFGLFVLGSQSSALAQDPTPDPEMVALGRAIFYDTDLSANGTQSCAACHASEVGYTGPDALVNATGAVYPGAIPNRFGNRKPPAAYAGDSPVLHLDGTTGTWFGGMFWDGRATGAHLGDPLAEQAQGPFLNPLEQAIANAQVLCVKVKQTDYAGLFEQVWGAGSINCAKDVAGVYEMVARSVAAFERSPEVNPFSSKFDLFWDDAIDTGKDVTIIKCGMGGGGMGGGVWVRWDAQAAVRTAGLVTAISALLTPSCWGWPCSIPGLAVPPATASSQDQQVIPCLPTSATTTSVSQRIQTTPFTPCPKHGIPTGRTGWTMGWAAI